MAPDTLVVAIEIGDPELANRLTALLADVPGLRLVLALIAEGASNKAIARRLAISVRTVKFHIASLLDKLDAQGRAEAVAQGARLGAIRR
jgi:FixJ family two-component response regulator